ncbi:MAG: nitroreductase family deazaflavin-dependent oxidoreductase [Acidimicrobiales bacterium]|jgi:deazaflavin-dependent oxidoreductase (nitroreductase family)|nr:nitroreductase family deazaflavin-dependent oxidoreductase [Acidimicrobiales bacterium]
MSPGTPKPYTAAQERFGTSFIRVLSAANTWLYRRSGGRLGGRFLRGAPVCLVTTVGRKSGQPRTVPLLYLAHGEDVVIVASKGGMSHHPLWYLNLQADPAVTIEIGARKQRMVARTASAEEKDALWPRLVAMYRDYDSYQARTERDIPVVICSPAGDG